MPHVSFRKRSLRQPALGGGEWDDYATGQSRKQEVLEKFFRSLSRTPGVCLAFDSRVEEHVHLAGEARVAISDDVRYRGSRIRTATIKDGATRRWPRFFRRRPQT